MLPWVVLVLVLALPAAAAAQEATLRDARLVITEGGRDVVTGVPTADGARATAVAERRPDGAVLTTDGGARIELTFERAGGSLRIVTRSPGAGALGFAFDRVDGERLLGLGERPVSADHAGQAEVETYVADGPYQPGLERAGISLFVPGPGFRDRDDATYFPIPWLLSTRGYGVLSENPQTSYHRLAAPGEWSLEVIDGPAELALRVFGGGTPAAALERFTEHVGRQPRVEAPWVFGPWYQPGGSVAEQVAQVRALREAGAPLSVAQTYLHYLPCGDQQGAEAAERARVAALHAEGVAVTTYFNPMICTDYQPVYDEAVAAGALLRDGSGAAQVYRYSSSPDPEDTFFVSQFDFTAEAGRAFYARLLGEAIADGHDGWMEDFGEYTPLDARASDGSTGSALHNSYVRDYHCAAYEAVRATPRPIVRFQRSGFTGAARCAQVVWSGDPTTGWGFDGLASQVRAALSAGLSGISTWGSDIGGFFAIGQNALTPELLRRWVQFGAFSPVMRTQRNGVSLPSRARPQVTDDDQIANWARWARVHNRLFPYLVAAGRRYERTGLPIMRHLSLLDPGLASEDHYLFGPDLLVAPILAPGRRERGVALPPGRWVDLWRAADPDTFRLGRAAVLAGGREVRVDAPLDEIPVLARAGTLLALLPRAVDTLAPYRAPRVTPLSTRRVDLVALPRGRSRARFLRGGVLVSRERRGRWVLRVRSERRRRYRLQASLATLRRPFRPCSARLGGRRVRLRHDRVTDVVRARFTARRGRLVVRGC